MKMPNNVEKTIGMLGNTKKTLGNFKKTLDNVLQNV
jgi:hypothetical protein